MPEMGLPKGETAIGLHSEYNYFEYLCDVSAAELLMPKDWFLQIAAGVGPGITGLLQMGETIANLQYHGDRTAPY